MTVYTRPSLQDLQNHFTAQCAGQWRVIGTQVGLSTGALDIIEYDNCNEAFPCCNAMFELWLELDTTATWDKLFAAIEPPTASHSASDEGD